MTATDRWQKDPSVQAMRRIFGAVEEAQKAFIEGLGVSPWDPRLRRWRERARVAFESAWSRAARLGATIGEGEAATLYTHCLGKILEADGVELPERLRTMDETLGIPGKEELR